MKHSIKTLLSIALLAVLTGCATMPEGVLLVTANDVVDCDPIGMVTNDALHDMTIANATADMMRSAERLGADSVVMQSQAGEHLEISMVGTAYNCKRNQK